MKMKGTKPSFTLYILQVKFNYHVEYEIALEKDKLETHCCKWIKIIEIVVD